MDAKKCLRIVYCSLILHASLAGDMYASLEYWGKGCRNKIEYESPCPFEKIYITREQVVCTPDGIFLRHPDGQLEKVRSMSEDCEGLFVIRILTQCSQCGRCYSGKCCPEGYSCPIYDQEVLPNIWAPP